MPGVVRTRVGYAGGISENPTYRNIGNHSEAIQIDYNPDKISYKELVKFFWNNHNPYHQPYSRQYYSILFYHNESQLNTALKVKNDLEEKSGKEIKTEFKTFEDFYLAEKYHQKYYLQQHNRFKKHYLDLYSWNEFINSTAVAKVNGYIGRKGKRKQLIKEIDKLGLPEKLQKKLLDIYGIDKKINSQNKNSNTCGIVTEED